MTEIPNIVRNRMKAAQAGDHPDANLLTAFAEQALPHRERVQALEHLARCADCRDVLAQATPPLSPAALPAHKDTAGASKVAWPGWATLRWGALAACVVIVGTAVFVRHDLQRSQTAAYVKSDSAQPSAVVLTEREAAQASPARDALISKTLVSEEKKQQPGQLAKAERRVMAPATTKPILPLPSAPVSNPTDLTSRAKGYEYAAEGDLAAAQKNRNAKDASNSLPAAAAGGALAGAPQPEPTPSNRKDEAPTTPVVNLPVVGRNTASVANVQSLSQASQAVQVNGANEAVEVQSGAVQAETTTEYSAKKAIPGKAKGAAADASVVTLPASATSFDKNVLTTAAETRGSRLEAELARSRLAPASRWTISSDGQLQHSIDSGKTWQPVTVADKVTFRALSANGPDVWVGGPAGLLYHSPDSGGHWTQIKPAADGTPLSSDIATIEFTDRLSGKLTTSTGETWTTADGGVAWHKQP